MRAGRLKHQIDRWRKRPRFRNPIAGTALILLLAAVLLLLLGQGRRLPPPEPAPAAPPPPILIPRKEEPPASVPAPNPAPIELPEETPPAPIHEEPAAEGCPQGCDVPPPGCDIKGNIALRTGEKIYHVPGGRWYGETVITPGKGEAWFCTEAEARANGWRKAKG